MGSLPREEHIATAGGLFYKINRQKHRVTKKGIARYSTQHFYLHGLNYIVPSKYQRTTIEPGSFSA